ncbi:MAG: PAS domain-containing protein [Candidatus Marinimicrobia bacterium]|nr:PAS domain-containing protein [Candidatus Neomarinimicrobiota bacterium]
MKRICAWCQTSLGEVSSNIHNEQAITHGICDICLSKLFKDKDVDFIPFLNSLPTPVVLIDDNNNYLSANSHALEILGKDHQDINKKRIGDVFTCENAHLEGGCGHTNRCGGCQMLQLINDTYEGKDSFDHVPVTLIQKHGNARQELNLELTTEKVNGLVLMRIDSHK